MTKYNEIIQFLHNKNDLEGMLMFLNKNDQYRQSAFTCTTITIIGLFFMLESTNLYHEFLYGSFSLLLILFTGFQIMQHWRFIAKVHKEIKL